MEVIEAITNDVIYKLSKNPESKTPEIIRKLIDPKHLKKAKEKLSEYLSAVEGYTDTNETYRKEVFKRPTLWKKFKDLVKS